MTARGRFGRAAALAWALAVASGVLLAAGCADDAPDDGPKLVTDDPAAGDGATLGDAGADGTSGSDDDATAGTDLDAPTDAAADDADPALADAGSPTDATIQGDDGPAVDDAAVADDAAADAAGTDANGATDSDGGDPADTTADVPVATCTGPACNDGNPCTTDACSAGVCTFAPNQAACDDGNVCTEADACQAGACAGKPAACDDGNACTSDGCVAGAGCTFTATTAACDDGKPCTVGDACAAGKCTGKAANCDDGKPCTTDSCDAATGCKHAPVADCGVCKPGYVASAGGACIDVDECQQPGACAANATCANSPGSFACACKAGFAGDGKACADVDECAGKTAQCAAGATCTNTPGSYTCACPPGSPGDGKTCAKKGSSAATPAVSCLEILTLYPGTADGVFWLDFDGGGPFKAATFLCDMKNGGWTLLMADDFEDGSSKGWTGSGTTKCGDFGSILGGVGQLGGGKAAQKVIPVSPPHEKVKLFLHYVRIDSWDGEEGVVKLDGAVVWKKKGAYWNGKLQCGTYFFDEKWDAGFEGAHKGGSLTVQASSTLDQDAKNESFGIDNAFLWVK